MDKACLRLYRKAQELHSRKYDKAEELRYMEEQTLQASSPRARPMPKNVYGDIAPTASVYRGFSSKLRPLPSGRPTYLNQSHILCNQELKNVLFILKQT